MAKIDLQLYIRKVYFMHQPLYYFQYFFDIAGTESSEEQ